MNSPETAAYLDANARRQRLRNAGWKLELCPRCHGNRKDPEMQREYCLCCNGEGEIWREPETIRDA